MSGTDDQEYHLIAAEGLSVGCRLRMPIRDERDVLLLSEGKVISETFLKNLRDRGVRRIRVHRSELPRLFADGNPPKEPAEQDSPESHRSRTAVDVYWTDMEGGGWKRHTFFSRDFSLSGMALLGSGERLAGVVLAAFTADGGTRICLRARVARVVEAEDGLVEYGLQFVARANEPEFVELTGMRARQSAAAHPHLGPGPQRNRSVT